MSRPIELFSELFSKSPESLKTPEPASINAGKPTDNSTPGNSTHGWKSELANATTSAADLLRQLNLSEHIKSTDTQADFKCLATASYIRKMRRGDIDDPLLRQVLPLALENDRQIQHGAMIDPVGDMNALAAPGLLHKYHGRALLISTGACAIHCRYCFRRAYPYQAASCTSKVLHDTLEYLNAHPEIDEIILSGGDPLTLDNDKLARLISNLEKVSHIQTLRIHTRLPVVLPSRIDTALIRLLQSTRFQVVMVIHTNHANELQSDEQAKLRLLHEAGTSLLNQSVLLKGINDDVDTLVALSKRLFRCKTLPYYLHLLDPVDGAMHFSVSKENALYLKQQIEQQLPGYLVPRLVQEIAGNRAKSAIFRI